MTHVAKLVDRALEIPVVPSFTSIGYTVRRRLDGWTDVDAYDLTGRVVAITGPTSGLGRAAAEVLAGNGAQLILLARNEDKVGAVRDHLTAATGNDRISTVVVDMGDLDAVRAAAKRVRDVTDRLDVLIHNAGALLNERRVAPSGLELTTVVQVVAPFLLTGLLFDRIESTPNSRVLTMSSGGMYTVGLTVDDLEMDEGSYRGATQYARAKRAQVTLNEMWAERTAGNDIYFHALHPGWADTPGVDAALPLFRKMVGPLLRSPQQGADTLVWLAADDGEPLATNGAFWHDRRVRPIHKVPATRRTDTPARRRALWDWVSEAAGWNLADAPSG
jgi:NAD(P)-dependent dehydrogenase (short-subunit alcohol dehydrogenase family)